MKLKRLLTVVVLLLSIVYLNLTARASQRIVDLIQHKERSQPEFFQNPKTDESIGARLIAQVLPQTKPQTQTQTRSQTQTQIQTQTQTQTQPQSQYLYIGFPAQLSWKYKTPAPLVAQPQTDETTVYVASKTGGIHRVNQENGQAVWRANVGDGIEEAFILINRALFVGTTGGKIFAISADTGKAFWRKQFDDESFMARPMADEKNLYFVSQKGSIVSINAKTGDPGWRFKIGSPCMTAPWVYNKKVYVGCNDKTLYAVDTQAGFVKWKFTAKAEIQGSPIAGAEGVFFGAEDGTFYRLDPETGVEYWKYKTGGAIRGVPMFYKNERTNRIEDVFTSSFDNFMYSFKIKNGGHTWLSPTLSRVYNRMHFDRALVFLAPFGTVVLGYDPHTGQRVGDFNAGVRIRSAPMTANDRLFLGLNDGRLVCLTRQPPPPPETEGTQSQTQTQSQSQTQTQTQTATQPEEEPEAEPEPMLESSQTQTQTQTQTQAQTRSL